MFHFLEQRHTADITQGQGETFDRKKYISHILYSLGIISGLRGISNHKPYTYNHKNYFFGSFQTQREDSKGVLQSSIASYVIRNMTYPLTEQKISIISDSKDVPWYKHTKRILGCIILFICITVTLYTILSWLEYTVSNITLSLGMGLVITYIGLYYYTHYLLPKNVPIEYPIFEKYFDVYAKDGLEARRILDTAVLENITKRGESVLGNAGKYYSKRITLQGNIVCICCVYQENTLEKAQPYIDTDTSSTVILLNALHPKFVAKRNHNKPIIRGKLYTPKNLTNGIHMFGSRISWVWTSIILSAFGVSRYLYGFADAIIVLLGLIFMSMVLYTIVLIYKIISGNF